MNEVYPHPDPNVEYGRYTVAGGELKYEEWLNLRRTQRIMVGNSPEWFNHPWEGEARRRRIAELEVALGY